MRAWQLVVRSRTFRFRFTAHCIFHIFVLFPQLLKKSQIVSFVGHLAGLLPSRKLRQCGLVLCLKFSQSCALLMEGMHVCGSQLNTQSKDLCTTCGYT